MGKLTHPIDPLPRVTNRRRLASVVAWVPLVVLSALLLTTGCGDNVRNSDKALRSFSFLAANNPGLPADVIAPIDGTTISATVPFGTNTRSLVATFEATGASVTVGGVAQTSGATANDFTGAVTYRVVAADGTTGDYRVAVVVASSSAKSLTALGFLTADNPGLAADVTALINGTAVTAILPFGSSVTALVATFSATGENVIVGGVTQISGAAVHDFTNSIVYRVVAVDGTIRDYTVTVTVAANSAKELLALSFRSTRNAGLRIDVTAAVSGTTVTATVPFGTSVTALVATFATTGQGVTVGATAQTSDVTPNDFTNPVVYRVRAADGTTRDYTVAVTVATATAKDLTALSFRSAFNAELSDDVTATLSGTTISATVPFGTNVTALVATFETTGQGVTVGGTAQASGATPNNFTNPVIYRVAAADGSTKDYTVIVTIAPSPAKDLTALSFRSAVNAELVADVTATITGTMVTATVPFGTHVSALVATFSTTGVRVLVGSTAQTSGVTPNNFTTPVIYRVVAADDSTKDYTVIVLVAGPIQRAYVKATNTGEGDVFGSSIALSADGSTLAVGAIRESSAAPGINGNQNDNSAPEAGAVYVYTRSGATWSPQAYIKSSDPEPGDRFGFSVALSGDGSILAVGDYLEDSGATGIDGDPTDNSAEAAGAVYVYTRSGTTWSQQAYVKASNTGPGDMFGQSVALSGDGRTLAVGAPGEDSAATGVDGNQIDDSAPSAGAAYVYTRSGAIWRQEAYVKASNTEHEPGVGNDDFGYSVALSADGSTLAVGADREDGGSTGVDGDQTSNLAHDSGAAYVFTRSGTLWTQAAYVKPSNTGSDNLFGSIVALSGDGATLAVGSWLENSAATGIDGDQRNRDARSSGAAYVYTRSGATWRQQAYVKASNTNGSDLFGYSLALSHDGSTLAVGAYQEASRATGSNGNQADNSAPGAGAVYVFTRDGMSWRQLSYVKASNTTSLDEFGYSVALSGDGATLAVGARFEASAATGVNGNQLDNTAPTAGAVYVFR